MPVCAPSAVHAVRAGEAEGQTGDRYRVYGFVVRLNALVIAAVIHVAAFALALYGWAQAPGQASRETLVAVTLPALPQDKPRHRPLPGAVLSRAEPPPVAAVPLRSVVIREPDLAPALTTALPEPPPIDGGRTDRLALTTQAFRDAVMARLEAGRRYPAEQLRAGQGGEGTLLFRIDRAGRLVEARVQSSTGRKALDRAALEIVRSAAPFPEIPPELPDELAITLPIAFLIVGTDARGGAR